MKKEKTIDNELELILEKNKSLEEDVLRAKADLINYRKRKDEEVGVMLKFANAELILTLLPILDNFEIALNNSGIDKDKSYIEGIKLIYTSLKETLEAYGLKEIDVINKKFDSKYSDCIYTESDENYEDDIILAVLKKGYMYSDRILRPAQVKVNKIEKNIEKESEKNE